jgi:hypothetical protein
VKLILFTILAFAGTFAQAQQAPDEEEDLMGPNSYHGLMMRLHSDVDTARETLIADLKKSEEEYRDFDEDVFTKILLDEKKLNAALWHLHNPEDMGEPNPYEK